MARPSLLGLRLFETVFLPWMRRRVHVRLAGLPRDLDAKLPLLIVANHVSWWDGFVLREIHRELRPAAPLRVLMTETELRRHPVLGWIAAVPMRPGSAASVLSAFRGLQRLRDRHPATVVLFFPQGRIWPSYRRPLGFERGASVLARSLSPVQILPVGLHLEPLADLRPTMFAAAGPPIRVAKRERLDIRSLEAAVEAQLHAVSAFVAEHGENAAQEWPAPFATLAPPPGGPPAGVRRLHPRLHIVPPEGGPGKTRGRKG